MDAIPDVAERCICCLSEENIPQNYRVQSEVFQTLFQASNLSLCYICKRIAQTSELFIQNVQGNQLLLQSLQSITDTDLKSLKLEAQPFLNLQKASTHTLHLTSDETKDEPFYTEVYHRSRVRLKVEKEDDTQDDDFFDNDMNYDEPLEIKNELKFEEGEILNLKPAKKNIKKSRKLKKNIKVKKKKECDLSSNAEDNPQIETVYITKTEYMQEKEELGKKQLYLESIYKCESCVKGFTLKEMYERHMKAHSKENGEFECELCYRRFTTDEKLISHQKYHRIRYKCKVCGLMRISRSTIQTHLGVVHGVIQDDQVYTCTFCKRIFEHKVALRKHIYYSHKRRRVTCDFCLKNYANVYSLRKHLMDKHAKEVGKGRVESKSHVCPECGKMFAFPASLVNHAKTHIQTRNYYCVECNKSFKTESSLNNHLNKTTIHVQYVDLPYQCEHCDKRFVSKRDLERHMNRIHLNIRPYQCDKCDKAYVNQWSLSQHTRYAHEGLQKPRVYPCSMCDKVFMRNSTRKSHMYTHTGERPYKCTKCTAQFSQAGIRNTHVKLVHMKLTRDGTPKALATATR